MPVIIDNDPVLEVSESESESEAEPEVDEADPEVDEADEAEPEVASEEESEVDDNTADTVPQLITIDLNTFNNKHIEDVVK
eukprot:Pgem_evm2s8792